MGTFMCLKWKQMAMCLHWNPVLYSVLVLARVELSVAKCVSINRPHESITRFVVSLLLHCKLYVTLRESMNVDDVLRTSGRNDECSLRRKSQRWAMKGKK